MTQLVRTGYLLEGGRRDPYGDPDFVNWPLIFDFAGTRTNRVPYYRLNGTRYASFGSVVGASYSRTGEQLSYNPVTGQWEVFAANVPSILAGAGQDISEGTTNKCTNYNAAPTDLTGVTKGGDAAATLTVVDDTAALIAAGFGDLISAGKMNGKVYKLDNAAGAASAFATVSGSVGNTNAHTVSVFVRGALLGVALATVTGYIGGGAYSAYTRLSGQKTPNGTSNNLFIGAAAGQVVYFILNQLEEKTYATNPVIVSGAAATRGNAQPVVTGLASLLTPPFTLVTVANMSAVDGVNRVFVSAAEGPSVPANRMFMRRDSSNSVSTVINAGGVSQPALSFSAKTGPRLIKHANRFRAGSFSAACDGVLAGPQAITNPTGQAQIFLGHSYDASQWLNSPLLFAGIAPDLTDAQLQALTASNDLLTDFL